MDAMCPECAGNGCEDCVGGVVQVQMADGVLYTKDCKDCGEHVGGCIVGGDGYKEVPPMRPCPFCGGIVECVPA